MKRNIHIRTTPDKPLKNPTQIVLAMSELDNSSLFKASFPVAWRVVRFAANQHQSADATWQESFGFSVAQISADNLITAGASAAAGPGQTVTLTGDEEDGFSWSPPEAHSDKTTFIAVNKTAKPKDFVVGIVSKTSPLIIEPVLSFKATPGGGSKLVARSTARMYAYATSGYQKNQVLEAAIQSDALAGMGGSNGVVLSGLDEDTFYQLYCDPTSGAAVLEKVGRP